MNKRSIIVGLICAMSMPLVAPLEASARPPEGADCARMPPPEDSGAPGPGAAEHRMHKPPFLRGVRLTDEQRTQIREILQARHDQMCQRMETVHEAHKELRALTRAPQFDAARAKEIADGSAKAISELEVLRAETDHQIFALLTPEQRRMVDERGPERRRPGGDRQAPPPPPER